MEQLIFFFLMIAIGYAAARSGLVSPQVADTMPGILLNICYPGMVIHTFTTAELDSLLHTGLPTAIATLSVTLTLFILGLVIFRRAPRQHRAYWCFVMGIGNVSYAALPLLGVFLSSEVMLLCVIHGAVQDLLIWSLYHPLFLGSVSADRQEMVKKTLSSPSLIAALVGICLAVFQLRLPSFLQYTADTLSAMTSPLALLLLGCLLHRYGALSWRHDWLAISYALLKVAVLPILLFCVLQCFLELQMALLLAILFGSPAPLTGIIWSKEYNGDPELAVHCTISSTLFFLAFMSAALLTLRLLGAL